MQKLNLLYVITKLELGGAQKQLLAIIGNLDKHKFTPFLLTAKDGLLLSEALSIGGLSVKKSKWLERPINPLKDFFALIEIYRFIKKNNVGIVHTHSSKAGILGRLAAKLAKVKFIIHTVHGWSFNDYQPAIKRLCFIRLERFCSWFTDKLIVISNYDKQTGLNNRIGEEDKYALIRYGIDYAAFERKDPEIRKELGIATDELVVGMVACFKPQKHPQDFIKLAYLTRKISPRVKFILIGDGILRKTVERLIRKFNLEAQVILTGWRRDVSRILSVIDIFVLTSLWEGLPIAALEAMASSKPIIATHSGGISEVICEGKTGFLVSPGDTNRISQRLGGLLKDENLRRELGENAKNSLNGNYCLENMLSNTENLYRDLVDA